MTTAETATGPGNQLATRRDVVMLSLRGRDLGPLPTTAPGPLTPPALRAWLEDELGLHFPDGPLIPGHAGPLDYLAHSFFEGRFVRDASGEWVKRPPDEIATADCIVWASRGGGKTFLGAVATLLDLVFKPAVQVRILGGSLEQSQRMNEHLQRLAARAGFSDDWGAHPAARAVRLDNGAAAQVLAASHTSVRGTRVQKLRCDEVDLFDPDLWKAAMLVTRSRRPAVGPWGHTVTGSVEALSTMHRPFGLMHDIVQSRDRTPLFAWGVIDVLENCPDERACDACGLFEDCDGRAKRPDRSRGGHVRIADALLQKSRVDRDTWESEMLCLRPRRTDAVYPAFDPARHVVREGDPRLAVRRPTSFFAAMDFGVRSESVVLLAGLDDAGVLLIEHEHVRTDQPVLAQVEVLRAWLDAGLCRDAPLRAVVIDPAGANRSDQTGVSNASVLRSAGWTVRFARTGIAAGIRLVRARLDPASGVETSGSQPPPARLLVHERCRRLIECLRTYHYPPGRPETLEPEKDGSDHACDALRYLVTILDGGERVQVLGY